MSEKRICDGDCEACQDQDELEGTQRGQANRMWEQERQIFGPALAKLGEGAIHAGADRSGAEAEEYFSAGSFYCTGECDIFEEIAGDGGVSTDGVIGLARDQDVLAVGGCGG